MSRTDNPVPLLDRSIRLVEDRDLQRIVAHIAAEPRQRVLFCNVHMLMLSLDDPDLAKAMDAAHWVFADGVPVAWLQRRVTGRPAQVVRGHEVLQAVCARAAARGERVGFFGSTPEVLARLAGNLRDHNPDLTVACLVAPPLMEWDIYVSADDLAQLRTANLDWLFIGLGCPKQEKWLAQNADALDCHALAVGAAFDWLAGTIAKPPGWMERVGLAWLYRLVQNPRRMWRRYLVYNSKFIVTAGRLLLGYRWRRLANHGGQR